MTARHIFYTGRVQGVGFRYTAKQLASGFDVSGWVKNLPDGRVEMLVAAFDAEELNAFLTELQENSVLANHIKETETHTVPAPAGLTGFTIIR
jgi:acylphosphatase